MKIILALMILFVMSTIAFGIKLYVKNEQSSGKIRKLLIANITGFAPLAAVSIILLVPDLVFAATAGATTSNAGLGYIAAALSTGMATIGAGYAVGAVGSSALGAVSEDEKILGKTLIFVGLAEGIAIYGLIISILILGKL